MAFMLAIDWVVVTKVQLHSNICVIKCVEIKPLFINASDNQKFEFSLKKKSGYKIICFVKTDPFYVKCLHIHTHLFRQCLWIIGV